MCPKTPKNKYHLELLRELERYKEECYAVERESKHRYVGSRKKMYGIKIPILSRVVKDWVKEHHNMSLKEYIDLLNSLLLFGYSHEEILVAGKLLKFLPQLRRQIEPTFLKNWLEVVEGWAEVDSICQNIFSAEEMLSKWNKWEKLISRFSLDMNIHKRRASLVLLVGPVRQSADERLLQLAFKNIEKLKGEKDILITKAISWLLRSLIKNHRKDVESYLSKYRQSLPQIVVRETTKKLLTGKK